MCNNPSRQPHEVNRIPESTTPVGRAEREDQWIRPQNLKACIGVSDPPPVAFIQRPITTSRCQFLRASLQPLKVETLFGKRRVTVPYLLNESLGNIGESSDPERL